MVTTGYIYDTSDGACLARVEDGVDVFDSTIPDGAKIATVRNGHVYGLHGESHGQLTPEGELIGGPTSDSLRKLTKGGQTTP